MWLGERQGLGVQLVDHAGQTRTDERARFRVERVVRDLRDIRNLLDQYNVVTHKPISPKKRVPKHPRRSEFVCVKRACCLPCPARLPCMSVISACPMFRDHQIATDDKLRMIDRRYRRVNRFRRKAAAGRLSRRTSFQILSTTSAGVTISIDIPPTIWYKGAICEEDPQRTSASAGTQEVRAFWLTSRGRHVALCVRAAFHKSRPWISPMNEALFRGLSLCIACVASLTPAVWGDDPNTPAIPEIASAGELAGSPGGQPRGHPFDVGPLAASAGFAGEQGTVRHGGVRG